MAFLFTGFDILPQSYDAMTGTTRLTPPEDRGYLIYPVRIMNRSTYDAYHFDPAAGKPASISYSVSKTGWVRVRLVSRDDIVLRTIQDWTPSHFGQTYETEWDGNDASGNPVDRKNMVVAFEAKDSAHERVHMDHPAESCRDPAITIVQPQLNDAGSKVERIVVTLEPEAVNSGYDTTFEGKLYLDFELAEKVLFPAGATQFVFDFDAGELEPGEHLLTVNIDDLKDHVGAASLRLLQDKDADPAKRLASGQE